jgi:hypothetical protein
MRSEGQGLGTGVALDRSWCGGGNDSVSATDCGIHSGPAIQLMKMKKGAVVIAALAGVLLSAGLYLWGPSKTPPRQKPLLALSTTNFSQFENAFDEVADAPQMILLLSPT